jgi:hypothetical protein
VQVGACSAVSGCRHPSASSKRGSTSSPAARSRDTSNTFAPQLANVLAMPFPMPRAAPVISATLPFSECSTLNLGVIDFLRYCISCEVICRSTVIVSVCMVANRTRRWLAALNQRNAEDTARSIELPWSNAFIGRNVPKGSGHVRIGVATSFKSVV